MPICPNGHTSTATDYCDTCGAPMRSAGPVDPALAAERLGAGEPTRIATGGLQPGVAGAEPSTNAAVKPCPHCGGANPPGALFCEACGYDFTTGSLPRTPGIAPAVPGDAAPAEYSPASGGGGGLLDLDAPVGPPAALSLDLDAPLPEPVEPVAGVAPVVGAGEPPVVPQAVHPVAAGVPASSEPGAAGADGEPVEAELVERDLGLAPGVEPDAVDAELVEVADAEESGLAPSPAESEEAVGAEGSGLAPSSVEPVDAVGAEELGLAYRAAAPAAGSPAGDPSAATEPVADSGVGGPAGTAADLSGSSSPSSSEPEAAQQPAAPELPAQSRPTDLADEADTVDASDQLAPAEEAPAPVVHEWAPEAQAPYAPAPHVAAPAAAPQVPAPASAPPVPVQTGSAEWVAEIWIDPDWYAGQDSPDQLPSPGLPRVVALRKRTALVGRPSTSRGIVPDVDAEPDTGVSRRHAEIATDGTRWWIEDLGSSNGTYVGEAGSPLPVEPIAGRTELGEDSRVYVGSWTRIVVRRASPDEADL